MNTNISVSVLSNLCNGLSVWLERLGYARTATVFKTVAIIASFGSTLLVKFKSAPPSTTSATTFRNYNEFIPCKPFSLLQSRNLFFQSFNMFRQDLRSHSFSFLNLQDFVKRNNPFSIFQENYSKFSLYMIMISSSCK